MLPKDREYYRQRFGYKPATAFSKERLPSIDRAFTAAWRDSMEEDDELHRKLEARDRLGAYNMLLDRLKNFDAERNDLDGLVELVAYGALVASTYTTEALPVPEWLETNLEAAKTEVKRRNQDYLAKEMKETEAALAALKSKEEKKADLQAKLDKLKTALGK